MKKPVAALFVLIPFCAGAADDIHPKVQEALDYRLPNNECIQPDRPGTGMDVVDDEGVVNRLDVDTYQIERYQRAENRWKKCVEDYKKGLLEDFETLKNSAQYGITQQQAKTILTNMALIQSAIESPTGNPPESSFRPE